MRGATGRGRLSRTLLLLALLFFCAVVTVRAAPLLPERFQVEFSELLKQEQQITRNSGRWYYDYHANLARNDHDEGHENNFCMGSQIVAPEYSKKACSLLFDSDGSMFVLYDTLNACCRLCHPGEGCTPLRRDWLLNATFIGMEVIDDLACEGWSEQGAVAQDYWYQTPEGLPCRYHETLSLPGVPAVDHNLTFIPSTYAETVVDVSVFAIPSICADDCPGQPF
jgi:hypothetical protein